MILMIALVPVATAVVVPVVVSVEVGGGGDCVVMMISMRTMSKM